MLRALPRRKRKKRKNPNPRIQTTSNTFLDML